MFPEGVKGKEMWCIKNRKRDRPSSQGAARGTCLPYRSAWIQASALPPPSSVLYFTPWEAAGVAQAVRSLSFPWKTWVLELVSMRSLSLFQINELNLEKKLGPSTVA